MMHYKERVYSQSVAWGKKGRRGIGLKKPPYLDFALPAETASDGGTSAPVRERIWRRAALRLSGRHGRDWSVDE